VPGHRGRPLSPRPNGAPAAASGLQRLLLAVIVNLAVLITWAAESTPRNRPPHIGGGDPPWGEQ
jgi:hypothetical protein